MESKYGKMQLDDIIFESRNKTYGAYALRQSYGKRMKRGIIGGMAIFSLMVSSPLIATRLASKKLDLDGQVVVMPPLEVNPPKNDIVPPPPPPPPPPPVRIATIRFSPPVVTNEAETEPPMPNPADITVNVANQTQVGENREAFVAAVVAPVAPPIDAPVAAKPVEDKPFVHLIVEQVPEFPDGAKAMFKWLSDNVKYPPIARENGIEGTVYIGFVVWNDGTIQNVQVKRGIGGGCNEEAVRVVRAMPTWKPGRQNGKAVNVAFTLPIKFKLE